MVWILSCMNLLVSQYPEISLLCEDLPTLYSGMITPLGMTFFLLSKWIHYWNKNNEYIIGWCRGDSHLSFDVLDVGNWCRIHRQIALKVKFGIAEFRNSGRSECRDFGIAALGRSECRHSVVRNAGPPIRNAGPAVEFPIPNPLKIAFGMAGCRNGDRDPFQAWWIFFKPFKGYA